MNGTAPLPPGRSKFEQLVAALGRKDPAMNEYAAEIFRRVGKPVVPLLVREAVCRGKQPDHRVRILDVIQRIGEPLDMAFFDLTMLLRHRVPRVREKAAEVIAALSPAGRSSPDATAVLSPAALGLMGGAVADADDQTAAVPSKRPSGGDAAGGRSSSPREHGRGEAEANG